MPAQRLREHKAHAGEARTQCVAGFGQVFGDVDTGREKVRHEDHVRCAGLHALRTAGFDVRFGQFQVRHPDDRVPPALAQGGRDELQVRIRFGPTAPVCDEQKRGWHGTLQGCGATGSSRIFREAVGTNGLFYISRMLGARVGNWFAEEEIGRGPLGVVYRARGFDESERIAAVKVFTEVRDPAAVQRLSAELLSLQRLDHANIAKTLDCGTHGGLAFVATEFVAGTDCAKRLEAGRLPWRDVLSIAVQAARALKHAHNRNVLHRDLKPAHLVLMPDGTLKVLAFGLAKVFSPPPNHAPAIGSSAYLPPEAASGKPLTRRSDLYSLGGVLYTLVTGRPPFSAGSVVELMHKQCYTLPERPALLVNDLPPEIDEFICTLLDKNPARRPGTAGALLEELERIRGKLERKGEKLTWPTKITPDTAEMAALPAALGGVGEGNDAPQEPRPLFKRPAVVIPLFLLAIAALVLPFAWPSPSADELFTAARPLIESENPDDWDAAEKYLDPLARKYPDRYKDEVINARRKLKDRRDLRHAIGDGTRVDPRTDAARGYLRGLRYAQAGEVAQARATWDGVVTAFGSVKSEERWVALSRAGVTFLTQPNNRPARQPLDRDPVRAALDRAKELDAQGRADDARAIRDALIALAEGDPVVRQMVDDSRKK